MTRPSALTHPQRAWLAAIELEVRELFEPAKRWQRSAPAERTLTELDLLHGTILTAASWGWSVDVKREDGDWLLTAAKSPGTRSSFVIRGTARHELYSEALALLADSLLHTIAIRRAADARRPRAAA